jgi:cyanosortase A-associated protein
MAIATSLTLGKSLVQSEKPSPLVAKYNFPESITLSQWDLLFTKPVNPNLVKPPAYITGTYIAGKHYRYRQHEKHLEIEMRYLVDTDGDLKTFITSQAGELAKALKQDGNGGFYSLYNDKNKAYLSACINPRGGSTVTSDRFNRNRLIYDTRINRIVPWLLGKADILDKRCLWAHLSLPLDRNTPIDETYQMLENVWFDWSDWWRSRFP